MFGANHFSYAGLLQELEDQADMILSTPGYHDEEVLTCISFTLELIQRDRATQEPGALSRRAVGDRRSGERRQESLAITFPDRRRAITDRRMAARRAA